MESRRVFFVAHLSISWVLQLFFGSEQFFFSRPETPPAGWEILLTWWFLIGRHLLQKKKCWQNSGIGITGKICPPASLILDLNLMVLQMLQWTPTCGCILEIYAWNKRSLKFKIYTAFVAPPPALLPRRAFRHNGEDQWRSGMAGCRDVYWVAWVHLRLSWQNWCALLIALAQMERFSGLDRLLAPEFSETAGFSQISYTAIWG